MSLLDYARARQIEDRQQNKIDELGKEKQERMSLILSSPDTKMIEFWCDECKKDLTALGHKSIILSFVEPFAKYDGKCPKGHRVYRYITDKTEDPYWRKSENVKRDRRRHAKDLLQPGDYGFQTLYGDPNKKRNDALEKQERQAYENRRS